MLIVWGEYLLLSQSTHALVLPTTLEDTVLVAFNLTGSFLLFNAIILGEQRQLCVIEKFRLYFTEFVVKGPSKNVPRSIKVLPLLPFHIPYSFFFIGEDELNNTKARSLPVKKFKNPLFLALFVLETSFPAIADWSHTDPSTARARLFPWRGLHTTKGSSIEGPVLGPGGLGGLQYFALSNLGATRISFIVGKMSISSTCPVLCCPAMEFRHVWR